MTWRGASTGKWPRLEHRELMWVKARIVWTSLALCEAFLVVALSFEMPTRFYEVSGFV
jgi:hypothetical protein